MKVVPVASSDIALFAYQEGEVRFTPTTPGNKGLCPLLSRGVER